MLRRRSTACGAGTHQGRSRQRTHDNDTEFARHARSRGKLGMDTCFVYPYSSWRRGNNGNRNGVVRRQLPKRCEIRMDMVRGLREIVDEPLESQGQQGRCTSK